MNLLTGIDVDCLARYVPRFIADKERCKCGNILRGVQTPPDCGLFRKVCTPDNPIGPCMVSTEGTCAAYFKYGR